MSQATPRFRSLIPYLTPRAGALHLRISHGPEGTTVLEKKSNPFLLVHESGPLALLVEGRLTTSVGREIKRVFLLVQQDDYRLVKDELRPITNQDVEQIWQEAFLLYSGSFSGRSLITLPEQVSPEHTLAPFQSLFFCKLKQQFFAPPCPNCSFPLEQCYDDDLLMRAGLPLYSTSLRRFLFCPSCLASVNSSDFYTVSLKETDPPMLKDQQDLIKGFARIGNGRESEGSLPCPECSEWPTCYGADGRAPSRITPFSFYPFHMLIFDAMSLNAIDFLALLSGSSFEELSADLANKHERGRMTCVSEVAKADPHQEHFFFEHDERYFLEVLYLKLSFLEELILQILVEPHGPEHPDLRTTLDRVWVKLPDHGGLLPLFWSFNVRLIDVGSPKACGHVLPETGNYSRLHYLGLAWFYVLLVNKSQSIAQVQRCIQHVINEQESPGDSLGARLRKYEDNPILHPKNIFWDPVTGKQTSVRSEWKRHWDEALRLGWLLVQACQSRGADWSREGFLREVDSLRDTIKASLFSGAPCAAPTYPEQENQAILSLLGRIITKWNSSTEAREDDLEKTVIVASGHGDAAAGTECFDRDEEVVQKTIILSTDTGETMPLDQAEDDDIPETMIIAPAGSTVSSAGAIPASSFTDVTRRPTSSAPSWEGEEDLEETMIVKKQEPHIEADDFLEETVIVSFGKTKDKK